MISECRIHLEVTVCSNAPPSICAFDQWIINVLRASHTVMRLHVIIDLLTLDQSLTTTYSSANSRVRISTPVSRYLIRYRTLCKVYTPKPLSGSLLLTPAMRLVVISAFALSYCPGDL